MFTILENKKTEKMDKKRLRVQDVAHTKRSKMDMEEVYSGISAGNAERNLAVIVERRRC